jgi:hypothetical protein
MRVELTAIKAAINVAMSHEIDQDESVPMELIETMAELHSRIDRLEEAEARPPDPEVHESAVAGEI